MDEHTELIVTKERLRYALGELEHYKERYNDLFDRVNDKHCDDPLLDEHLEAGRKIVLEPKEQVRWNKTH